VAVLVKTGRLEEARRQLEKLAEVNRLGINEEWEFNDMKCIPSTQNMNRLTGTIVTPLWMICRRDPMWS